MDAPGVDTILSDYQTCQSLLARLSAMHARALSDNATLNLQVSKLHTIVRESGERRHDIVGLTVEQQQSLGFPRPLNSTIGTIKLNHGSMEADVDGVILQADASEEKQIVFSEPIRPSAGDPHPKYVSPVSQMHTPEEDIEQIFDQLVIGDWDSEGDRSHQSITPLDKWADIVYMLLDPDGRTLDEAPDLGIYDVWLISSEQRNNANRDPSKSTKSDTRRRSKAEGTLLGVLHGHYVRDHNNVLQRFIMDPDGFKLMLWGLLGALLLLYDVLAIPLSFFNMPAHALEVFSEINRGVLGYWIVDVFVQLLSGFHAQNFIDMRPPQIFYNYIRTWFVPDSLILSIDCALLLFTSIVAKGSSSLRIIRILRLLRMLRFFRIRRLSNLKSFLDKISLNVTSALFQLISSLMKQVLMIMLVNHYIACAWYYVGYSSTRNGENPESWLTANEIESVGVERQYAFAFHWSLTQFSPATNNINPQNVMERAFACFVVIFAMVVFSSFISNVTSTVNQLNQMSAKKVHAESLIRKFLLQRSISTDLGGAIMDFFHTNFYRNHERLDESDIQILALLPDRLTYRLHDEMYRPTWSSSTLLKKFIGRETSLISRLCHEANSLQFYLANQDIFTGGTSCKTVYFLADGLSEYFAACRRSSIFDPRKSLEPTNNLGAGSWLSEMAFWIPWRHRGRMTCAGTCEAVHIDSDMFATCISEHGGKVHHFLCVLAIYLVGHVERQVDDGVHLTDLAMRSRDLENITSRVLQFVDNLATCSFIRESLGSPK